MDQLVRHLKQQNYSDWTIHTNCKHIKRAIIIAVEKDLITAPNSGSFRMKRGNGSKDHFTESEYSKLIAFKPTSTKDANIFNAFLFFSIAGGIRFGDCMLLTYQNIVLVENKIGKETIRLRYKMKNTRKDIDIYLPSLALQYKFIDAKLIGANQLIFNILPKNYQALTKDKLGMKLSSLNAMVNQRIKKLQYQARLSRALSFHKARHTFFVRGLLKKVNYMTLKDLGGLSDVTILQNHSAIQSTIYIIVTLFKYIYKNCLNEKMRMLPSKKQISAEV